MKFLLLSLVLLLPYVYADSIEVRVDEEKVVAGESFNLYVTVSISGDDEPNINFDPIGAEVIRKIESGVTSRMSYINGRVTRTKELNYTYELMPQKTGPVKIKNITAEVGGQTLKHKDIRLTALRTAPKSKDFFALAIPSKTEVFKGEAIVLRYYLYKRVRVANFDIKKYPKLKGFLKRFVQESSREERVNYKGQIYIRSILYTQLLFPESTGELKIDPIRLTVHYSVISRNDPFGGFGLGLGLGKVRSKSVSSDPITIKVNPVPAGSVPPHFSGLVGKHSFKFEINKNKFLVNEPLEAKLIVEGPGELENFEAPKLFSHPSLEEFEISGDLKINQDLTAIKSFDYTYLTRGALKQDAREFPISYFDPETMSFSTVILTIPPIEVEGSVSAAPLKNKAKQEKILEPNQLNENKKEEHKIEDIGVVSPLFAYSSMGSNWLRKLNFLLLGLIFFLVFIPILLSLKQRKINYEYEEYWLQIQKQGLSYSNLFQLLSSLKKGTEQDIYQVIENSKLSEKEANYFSSTLKKLEESQFKTKQKVDLKVNKTYFNSLFKLIRNESIR